MNKHSNSPFGEIADHAASTNEIPLGRQLEGKFAVVTGSTQGLGLVAVELMLKRGLAGALICGRNADAGEKAAKRLTTDTQKVVYQQADLANLSDCKAIIDRAVSEFGTLDILVNSAGITDRGGILDGDAELWERTFDINARAPFFLIQHAAKYMIAQEKPGSIVNVATVTAHGGTPFLGVYAASKAALVATTKNAGFSLARYGVRVNALAIGWMDTPAEDATQRKFHGMKEGWQNEAGQKLPSGRLLKMPEVARWIVHLASAESGIMTGSVIDFDHGVVGCYEETPFPAPR